MIEDKAILRYLKEGTRVEISTQFMPAPLSGSIKEVTPDFFVLADNGLLRLISVSQVRMITVMDYVEAPACGAETAGELCQGNDAPSPVADAVAVEAASDALPADDTSGNASDAENDASGYEPIYRTSIDTPKVKIIGKIDLTTLPRRKNDPKNDSDAAAPEEPRQEDARHNVPFPDEDDLWETDYVPAMGTIKSIGSQFGFVRTWDEKDIYFLRNQLITLGAEEPLRPGTPVVFTVGRNKVGMVANSVHEVMNVGKTLELIEALQDRGDRIHTRNLRNELLECFPNEQSLRDELFAMGLLNQAGRTGGFRPRMNNYDRRPAGTPHKPNPAPALNPQAAPYSEVAMREKELAQNLLPEKYDEYMTAVRALLSEVLADDAAPNQRGLAYHLFTRLIKNASETDHASLKEMACGFFDGCGEPRKADYFRRMTWRPKTDQ